jgi:hypothetical protein
MVAGTLTVSIVPLVFKTKKYVRIRNPLTLCRGGWETYVSIEFSGTAGTAATTLPANDDDLCHWCAGEQRNQI